MSWFTYVVTGGSRLFSQALVLGLLVLPMGLLAAEVEWKAGGAGAWSEAGNWSSGGVPGPGDTVIFRPEASNADCLVDVNADVRRIELRAGYGGTVAQGAGIVVQTGSLGLDGGIFRLGANGKLVLTGKNVPLSGAGLLDTTTNVPNSVEYAGDGEVKIAAGAPVGSYDSLSMVPPKGFSRYDVLRGTSGDFDYDSIALDSQNGFAYAATSLSTPNRVVKIRLSDFARVGVLYLASGENNPSASFIDNGFLYVALRMSPGRIVKIRLSDFSRVGTLTLNTGENNPISAVCDGQDSVAYMGLRTSPGQIVKVDLNSMTRVASLTLDSGENELVAAAGDLSAGFAYFGTYASPAKIIKLRLSDFTVLDKLVLSPGEDFIHAAIIDPARDCMYWGTSTAPGRIVMVRLSDFSRQSALTLEPGEDGVRSAVRDEVTNCAYFGTNTNNGILVKVDLNTFTRLEGLALGPNEFNLFLSAVIDPGAGFAYFTTEAWVATLVKVNLRYRSAEWHPTSALEIRKDLSIGAGVLHSDGQVISLGRDWTNAGTFRPGQGTVVLTGQDQTIKGNNAFHSLRKHSATGGTLRFESGKTQAVTGALDLQGVAGNPLHVRGTQDGQAWRLDANTDQAIQYAAVRDTDASSGSPVWASKSTDDGGNQNVFFGAPVQVAITSPAVSATSPAWVEGTNSGDVTSIAVSVDGLASFNASRLSRTRWYASQGSASGPFGITLSPAAPTRLDFTVNNAFGDTATLSQDLSWAPTDVAGKSFSTQSLVIRAGDSVLLTASGAGSALSIDADGNGTTEYVGSPGQVFPHLYASAGSFVVRAKIDGIEIGSLTIVVMTADLSKPIACEVGFEREKNVVIAPAAQASNIVFGVNDPLLLSTSVKGPFNTVDGQGTTIRLKASRRGTPVLTARIGTASGPLVAWREIDEFSRDLPAMWSVLVNNQTETGSTSLTLRPYIANLRFQFDMFASTATFAGGLKRLSINTSDIDPLTQQPLFKQVFDPETGETIGRYVLEVEVPAGEDKYCFTSRAYQSASAETSVSTVEATNGSVCRAEVKGLTLCAGGTGTLQLKVVESLTQGSKLDVSTSGAGMPPHFKATGTNVLPKGFDCSAPEGTITNAEIIAFEAGYYDVYIDDTPFPRAILAVDITFNPTGVKVRVGKTVTTQATIEPPDAINEVTFSLWTTGISSADKTKFTSPSETITITGLAEGTTILYAEILNDLGSQRCMGLGITVEPNENYISAIGSCAPSSTWPARVLFPRYQPLPVSVSASGVPEDSTVRYELTSALFPALNDAKEVSGGSQASFELRYPLDGAYASADHLRLTASVDGGETKVIFDTKTYPVLVTLAPNPDSNCGRDRVDLRVKAPLNEAGNKVIATTTPWHDDLKTLITIDLVGPNVGEPGQPIVNLDRTHPDGPTTLLSPRADDLSKTGITHLVASMTATCGSQSICSNYLDIYVWELGDANAWVEGRAFAPPAIDMPKPDTLQPGDQNGYGLQFMAQRDNGDCSGEEGGYRDQWVFDWTVTGGPGFTMNPARTEGDNRSLSSGSITQGVRVGRYEVMVISRRKTGPFPGELMRRQAFLFREGRLRAAPEVVLAGGSDGPNDTLHQSLLDFRIAGDISLQGMQLETRRTYGVRIMPALTEVASSHWKFSSSDLVIKQHPVDFVIGAYAQVPLVNNMTVLVAHTTVDQIDGEFSEITIIQPASGRIYPNGAVQIQAAYSFGGRTTSHIIRGDVSSSEARPKNGNMTLSTYSAEFKFRGGPPSGPSGFIADVIKTVPTRDDTTNPIFETVQIILTDTRLFDAEKGNVPLTDSKIFRVNGAEPSYWRVDSGDRGGSFWNWATLIDTNALGRSFQNGTQSYTGTFGESETWHAADLKTDGTVDKLTALAKDLNGAQQPLNDLQPQWNRTVANMKTAIIEFNAFIKGVERTQELIGIINDIRGLIAAIKDLKKILKQTEEEAKREKDPIKRLELLKKIEELREALNDADAALRKLVEKYNQIAEEIKGVTNVFSPAILLDSSTRLVDEAHQLRDLLLQYRQNELAKAEQLCDFIQDLANIIENANVETIDPDEALKRERLAGSGLDGMVNRAVRIREAIQDARSAISALRTAILALDNHIDAASWSSTLEGLKTIALKVFAQALSKIPLSKELERLEELLGLKGKLLKELKAYLDTKVNEDFLAVTQDAELVMSQANTALEKTRSVLVDSSQLARDIIHPYRIWITPTLEFPEKVLNDPARNLTPIPHW